MDAAKCANIKYLHIYSGILPLGTNIYGNIANMRQYMLIDIRKYWRRAISSTYDGMMRRLIDKTYYVTNCDNLMMHIKYEISCWCI